MSASAPQLPDHDPSGVPRPVDPARVTAAKGNSGIIVGEVGQPPQMSATTQSDNYRTAFIKVYQDAGVIGVAMLTLLALCVAMAIFSSRILKMYAALVTSNNALVAANADATIKIATAMGVMQSQLKASTDLFERKSSELETQARQNSERFDRFENRVMAFLRIVASTTDPEERRRLFSRDWTGDHS